MNEPLLGIRNRVLRNFVNRRNTVLPLVAILAALALRSSRGLQAEVPVADVPGQPLAANALRVIQALDYLGAPLDVSRVAAIKEAARERDAQRIQTLLDPQVLVVVSLNPEVRVKAERGPARGILQQAGYTPHLVKVLNNSTVSRPLQVTSPQSGPVYAGAAEAILRRQAQTELLANANEQRATDRFLELEMFRTQPMTRQLSGLAVEYALMLIYSSEAGPREATLAFDVGAGTQDIGFRGEVPILFEIQPAVPVGLEIYDADGKPTAARLEVRDPQGHVYPPQAKRLAPDFFFQPQIYRHHGQTVLLPPGTLTIEYGRGPEYRRQTKQVRIEPSMRDPTVRLDLERWVDPQAFGFYSGDHHIHGAGCSHYDNPTQGVTPQDMFVQVKGEGLNVGCVLTWGPCFDFQRQYFSPQADEISEPFTVLKYDLEISGFGSAALGHVCLLNLTDQTYPGSEGGKTKGWPTWTVPVLRWAKEQGGVTGYPHSAMHVDADAGATRLVAQNDRDQDGMLSQIEANAALLPFAFREMDQDQDQLLTHQELKSALDRAADQLPNLAVPAMNGAGAMEIFVSTPAGVCDFISAMDTARIPEWNTWYHLLNCGFPLKLSGETDFPCMSSRRVGQGRVYVQLGPQEQIDFKSWCDGLRRGRSYVSDGFAHALRFTVEGSQPGADDVRIDSPGEVQVSATVAFAPEQPEGVAFGNLQPADGPRMVGDTVNLHAPRSRQWLQGGTRRVELVRNGRVIASADVPADGEVHELTWTVAIDKSSWLAIRQFPQLHSNPVNILVGGQPIRASRESARWCAEATQLLWENRHQFIHPEEQAAAKAAYDQAIAIYEEIAGS